MSGYMDTDCFYPGHCNSCKCGPRIQCRVLFIYPPVLNEIFVGMMAEPSSWLIDLSFFKFRIQ